MQYNILYTLEDALKIRRQYHVWYTKAPLATEKNTNCITAVDPRIAGETISPGDGLWV